MMIGSIEIEIARDAAKRSLRHFVALPVHFKKIRTTSVRHCTV